MIILHEISPNETRLLFFRVLSKDLSSSSSTTIGTLLSPSSPLFRLRFREVFGVGGGGVGMVRYFGLKWPLSSGPALNFLLELTKLSNSLFIQTSLFKSTSPVDDRTGGRFTTDSFKELLDRLPDLLAAGAADLLAAGAADWLAAGAACAVFVHSLAFADVLGAAAGA